MNPIRINIFCLGMYISSGLFAFDAASQQLQAELDVLVVQLKTKGLLQEYHERMKRVVGMNLLRSYDIDPIAYVQEGIALANFLLNRKESEQLPEQAESLLASDKDNQMTQDQQMQYFQREIEDIKKALFKIDAQITQLEKFVRSKKENV